MNWGLTAGNPMARVLAMTLVFQGVTHGLSIPGMIQVDNVDPLWAALSGGAASLLAFVASVRLTKPGGYLLGWLTQVAGLALGFGTPWMFLMGGIITLIYVIAFVLGRRLERLDPQG